MNKLRKNITAIFGFAVLAIVFASCARGGYGCPNELEMATDVLNCLINK